jgi:WS/DGAT/MGAT family acyltransferase
LKGKIMTPIVRASSTDLMELASETAGFPMQVAAVLVLDTEAPLDLAEVRRTLAERIPAVPRLRQRLVRAPYGGGRPLWVDDPRFHIDHHVHAVRCPEPGDEAALLGVAGRMVTSRLPLDRPLWAATLVTGLAGGRSAVVIALHHVLSDGIGGLAVLARLVDGVAGAPARSFPRSMPSRREMFADAFASRLRAVAQLPSRVRRAGAGLAELKPASTPLAPHCSLNRPIGPRRALVVARADLRAVHDAAHRYGGTVNDAVLSAVAGALRTVLRHRGEDADRFVFSVPVSSRRAASVTQLGNQVGVIPMDVPATGDAVSRLAAIARTSRHRKTATPGASAALLAPALRALARLGVLRWYVSRQRLVTTFVTNLHGPETRLSFLGAPVAEVIPVGMTTGNVTAAFAVLSYAGTLVITVVADPGTCPDLPVLAASLQAELDALTAYADAPVN